MYIRLGNAQRHRDRQTAAAAAHVQRGGGGVRPQGSDGPLRQQLRFGAGNEHPFVHKKVPPQERLYTGQILQWRAGLALFAQGTKLLLIS